MNESSNECVLKPLVGRCVGCDKTIRHDDKYCIDCCRKATPEGTPLKRLRRYGFRITYAQRQIMNLGRDICGAIPTEVDDGYCTIKMSNLYVACDGKTYIGHQWITQGGSSYSWSESYPPNNQPQGRDVSARPPGGAG